MEETMVSTGEGTSKQLDFTVKTEVEVTEEDGDEDHFNTMALLELAACTLESDQEPLPLSSTDVIENELSGRMVCLHCLEHLHKNMVQDHMVTIHGYRRVHYKCRICKQLFKDQLSLSTHKEACKPATKRKMRKSFNQILKEVDQIIAENIFFSVCCPICQVDTPKTELKEHLLKDHRQPETNLLCNLCFKTFKSKLTLKEHIKLVHDAVEESEECDLCGQRFRSQKYLANHKRNVHPVDNKEHRCSVCKKMYKSRLCLHQHMKYVHPPESAMVTCDNCEKRFKSKINLYQHLKVSHGCKKKT